MSEILDDISVVSSDKIEIWDNSKRAKNLLIVFWIIVGLTFAGLFTGYNELQILKNVQMGVIISEQEAYTSDLIQMVMGMAQFVIYILSVVMFLNWFRRAYGNLHRVGVKNLKNGETMAVWAWFIPIVSLFKPVQIMNEIWTKTQRKIQELDTSYSIKSVGLIIGLWWTLHIISNLIGRYILKTAFKDETIEQLIEASQATLISDSMQIPEALLVVLIVSKLSKIELKLAEEIEKSGGNIVYK